MQKIEKILNQPDMFPSHLDLEDGTLHFCKMNKQTYATSSWLDERKKTVDGQYYKYSLSQIFQLFHKHEINFPQVNYIFHTSHCGSTLLARCLNELSNILVLKEPLIFRQLSVMKRDNRVNAMVESGQWDMLLSMCIKLLGRTYHKSDVVLVKATSICHNLVDDVLLKNPMSKGLFLFSRIEDFMVSMYKDRQRIDIYLAQYYPLLIADLLSAGVLNQGDVEKLSEPKKIAAMWLARVVVYYKCQSQLQPDQFKSLELKKLIDNPSAYLKLVANHFSYDISEAELEHICMEGPMTSYSKMTEKTWDSAKAADNNKHVLNTFKNEINEAVEWVSDASAGHLYTNVKNSL